MAKTGVRGIPEPPQRAVRRVREARARDARGARYNGGYKPPPHSTNRRQAADTRDKRGMTHIYILCATDAADNLSDAENVVLADLIIIVGRIDRAAEDRVAAIVDAFEYDTAGSVENVRLAPIDIVCLRDESADEVIAGVVVRHH